MYIVCEGHVLVMNSAETAATTTIARSFRTIESAHGCVTVIYRYNIHVNAICEKVSMYDRLLIH